MNKYIKFGLIGLVVLLAGYMLGRWTSGHEEVPKQSQKKEILAEVEDWTCSMHPQIHQSEPGKCPICGMDLIPVTKVDDEDQNSGVVSLSSSDIRLGNVETSKVTYRDSQKEISLQGKVAADERKVYSQTAHFTGRIEALNINFTGEYVRAGQVIASIYSPELFTAQEELLESINFKDSNPVLYESARTKLKRWKLDDDQINQIIQSGKAIEDFPVKADVNGYAIRKYVNLLDHVMEGDPMYEIANLSSVWVLFDAYESDLLWIKKGDLVEFEIYSLPGKVFSGKVQFIDPVVNPQTRTVSIRVEVPNVNFLLKPEMFVSGRLSTKLGGDQTLSVPKSAVMWTGKRSIVYVKQPGSDFKFSMREVVLGPSLGNEYVVEEGLKDGEEIVTNGAFTVDAATQLARKKSMMNETEISGDGLHHHGDHVPGSGQRQQNMDASEKEKSELPEPEGIIPNGFKKQLQDVYDTYLMIKDALVASDADKAKKGAENLNNALTQVDMTLVKGRDHLYWMDRLNGMQEVAKTIVNHIQLDGQRKAFSGLTTELLKGIKYFGLIDEKIYYQYCPMAFDSKGEYWMSREEEIRNPYFGDEMLSCGSVEEIIEFKN